MERKIGLIDVNFMGICFLIKKQMLRTQSIQKAMMNIDLNKLVRSYRSIAKQAVLYFFSIMLPRNWRSIFFLPQEVISSLFQGPNTVLFIPLL